MCGHQESGYGLGGATRGAQVCGQDHLRVTALGAMVVGTIRRVAVGITVAAIGAENNYILKKRQFHFWDCLFFASYYSLNFFRQSFNEEYHDVGFDAKSAAADF
jgi:hypothetical protein